MPAAFAETAGWLHGPRSPEAGRSARAACRRIKPGLPPSLLSPRPCAGVPAGIEQRCPRPAARRQDTATRKRASPISLSLPFLRGLHGELLALAGRGIMRRVCGLGLLLQSGAAQKGLEGKRFPGREIARLRGGGAPAETGMPQELGESAVLVLEINPGQLRAQSAAPASTLHGVACAARLRAVLEAGLAGEEAAAILDFGGRAKFGVSFVGWLDVRPAHGDVIENVIDLLFREIGPVRHALPLELREERDGRGVARLDYPGRAA